MHKIIDWLDSTTKLFGQFNQWAILLMVVITALVAILRYCFSLGWIWLQESVTYLHSLFFLGTISLGLLNQGHVRVDIFYRLVSLPTQAKIDLFGTLFLLFPFCILVFTQSFGYVLSSWSILEGSRETGGIPAIFLLKSLLLIFPVTLFLQGLSQACKAILTLGVKEQ